MLDDAFFFNRTRLERIGVVRPEIGLLLGWSAGSECDTPLQKQERRWAGECCWRTFHRWGDLIFIVYVFPVGW